MHLLALGFKIGTLEAGEMLAKSELVTLPTLVLVGELRAHIIEVRKPSIVCLGSTHIAGLNVNRGACHTRVI